MGASIPPDVVTGGILGTAFAITAGAGTETALVLGLPIATLTLILKNIYLGLLIPIMSQKADQYAEEGAYKGGAHAFTCRLWLIVHASAHCNYFICRGQQHH